MKSLSLVLLLIASTFISSHYMIDKLIANGSYNSKSKTLKIIGNLLFSNGYEAAFVAGVLGNIYHEGSIGKFESSAYISHPELEPQYLKYMDQLYGYRSKYSGKIITEVSMHELETLLNQLKRDGWNRGKFGLGCVQWTGSRTYNLFQVYKSECGGANKITLEQATSAEGKMVINELRNGYSYVYNQWKSNNPNPNTPNAAYNAGHIITMKYEIPADTQNQANKRGRTANDMYNIMTR